MASVDPHIGIMLIDPDVSIANVDTDNSTFTQAGPGPGVGSSSDPTSKWRPKVSDNQSQGIILKTLRGGYAGPGNGTRIAYALTDDIDSVTGEPDDSDWRGWNEPNVLVNWSAPDEGWGSGTDWGGYAATCLDGNMIIVTARENGTSGGYTWQHDPRDGTWTLLYSWFLPSAPGLTSLAIAHAVDPTNGRLLLFSVDGGAGDPTQITYYSDDGGSTWDVYSIGGWGGNVTYTALERLRIAPRISGAWLATYNGHQFSSADHGVTWDQVNNALDGSEHVPLTTQAGFCTVFRRDGDFYLCARVTNSAEADIADATDIVIDNSRAISICNAIVDYDGTIYAYSRGVAGVDSDEVIMYRSTDGGSSWTKYTWGALSGSSAGPYGAFECVVAAAGQVHIIGSPLNADADVENTVQMLTFGGWDQLETGAGATQAYEGRRERVAWGRYYGSATDVYDGSSYVPWDVPEVMGWAHVGAATARDFGNATPGFHQQCTNLQQDYYSDNGAGIHKDYTNGIAALIVAIAPTLDNAVALPSPGIFIRAALEDASYSYGMSIDIGIDGVAIRDVQASVRRVAKTDIDMTQKTYFKWHVTKGKCWVWYRQGVSTEWTVLADGVHLSDGGGAVEDKTEWGHNLSGTAGTCHVYWQFVGASYGGDWRWGVTALEDSARTPADKVLGLLFGHPMPGPPYVFPFPDGAIGEDASGTAYGASFMSATGGPTHSGEEVTIYPTYENGLINAIPGEVPSPSIPWKAEDDSTLDLQWNFGDDQEKWLGSAFGFVLINAVPRIWYISRWTGAGWGTPVQLDLGIGSGLSWTRKGRIIYPSVGTTTIDSYIPPNGLKGGYFETDDGSAFWITKNSGGYWTGDSTYQQLRLEVQDADGSASSGSAGVIVAPRGLKVCYLDDDTPTQKVRVYAASGQPSPEGVYQAGLLGVGRVLGLGGVPGWDWQRTRSYPREVSRAPDDSPILRKTGAARDTVTYGWSDAPIDLYNIYKLSRTPSAVKASTHLPIGTAEDAPFVLPELAGEDLQNGTLPCCLIRQLPSDTSALYGTFDFLYGVLMIESLGVTGIVGDEGDQEWVRLDSTSFEQVP